MAFNNNLEKAKKLKLTSKLHANLPWYEVVLWASCWIFGVLYSMYNVYLASMKHVEHMHDGHFEKGFIGTYHKDVSDLGWSSFTKNFWRSLPWYFVHFMGTQIFQRHHRGILPIFQLSLPLLFINFELGFRPFILLLAQPLVIFCVAEIFQRTIIVWGSAVAILGLSNQTFIATFIQWAFEDATIHTRYMTLCSGSIQDVSVFALIIFGMKSLKNIGFGNS